MNERTKVRAGMLVGAFLTADALLNLYWATGSIWPATDQTTLSFAVLNGNYSFAVPVTVPLGAMSLCGAALVLARVHRLGAVGERIPRVLRRVGIAAVAGALLVRGLVGIAWIAGIGAHRGTPFYTLNLLVYTPICLAMFAAAALAARSKLAAA